MNTLAPTTAPTATLPRHAALRSYWLEAKYEFLRLLRARYPLGQSPPGPP